STHILPEVEIMCSRVIVIHKGRIRASDTAENLLKNHRASGSMRIEAKVGSDNAADALSKIPGVKDVAAETDGDYTNFQLRLEANSDPSEEVMHLATSRQWTVRELMRRRPTLEDVFVELTHSDD
ncbi:MAG: transporter related, partial [Chthoniobacter sp.]|nr:transporter related [Chthoniobacter sp.]